VTRTGQKQSHKQKGAQQSRSLDLGDHCWCIKIQEHAPLWPPPQPSNAHRVGEPRISARLSEKKNHRTCELKRRKLATSYRISQLERTIHGERKILTFSMM